MTDPTGETAGYTGHRKPGNSSPQPPQEPELLSSAHYEQELKKLRDEYAWELDPRGNNYSLWEALPERKREYEQKRQILEAEYEKALAREKSAEEARQLHAQEAEINAAIAEFDKARAEGHDGESWYEHAEMESQKINQKLAQKEKELRLLEQVEQQGVWEAGTYMGPVDKSAEKKGPECPDRTTARPGPGGGQDPGLRHKFAILRHSHERGL